MESSQKDRRRRIVRSKLERRQIVEETFRAGASVSRVARAHDINANLLFYWRKLYREGHLDVEAPAAGALLPVKITDSTPQLQPVVPNKNARKRVGTIDIDLGHARVRIEGSADPDCVRAALEALVR
jgi:transposase